MLVSYSSEELSDPTRPTWSGPRLRHPVKGDTALDPERLPSYRMSPWADARGSTPRALFVKTRRSASRTLSLDSPPLPRVNVAVGSCRVRPCVLTPCGAWGCWARDTSWPTLCNPHFSKNEYPYSVKLSVRSRAETPSLANELCVSRRSARFGWPPRHRPGVFFPRELCFA